MLEKDGGMKVCSSYCSNISHLLFLAWRDCRMPSDEPIEDVPKLTRMSSPYIELGLPPTFSTWSQVTFLHMYLLTVRLRALPSHESVQTYSRHLIDHFSHSAEERMDILHGLTGRGIRNKFLKDLFIQWRGILAAYDEGLVKGDAVLGAAVWRNLWKASYTGPDGQEMDWTKVAMVVAYMRRVLSEISQVSEGDLITNLGRRSGGKPGIFEYSELDKKLVDAKR